MQQKVKFDYTNLLKKSVGKEGVSLEHISSSTRILSNLIRRIKQSPPGFTFLPSMKNELHNIQSYVQTVKGIFKNIVVIGIGGSCLGPKAIHYALYSQYYNIIKSKYPSVFFLDNIDPEEVNTLANILNLKKTLFIVITKSGSTSETIANFLIFRDRLKKKIKGKINSHIITITSKRGWLYETSKKENYKIFFIPEDVGGRYSVLSSVGLVPLSCVGIDTKSLLKGAEDIKPFTEKVNPLRNISFLYAYFNYLFYKKGKRINVFFPYSSGLKLFSEWFAQLWAESLGKSFIGPTPVKAVGVTDQHSQLQLYIDGPFDKLITFVSVEKFSKDVKIGCYPSHFLSNRSITKLFKSEENATILALTKRKRVNCSFIVPAIEPYYLGQLIYILEMATAFLGFLFKIDPFNQPGVELGKRLTYALMGKQDYKKEKAKIEKEIKDNSKYIC